MALDDSDDDVRQEDDWRRPQALERAVPGPSGAVSSSVIVSAVEDANSQEAGGFIPEADDAEDDGAHMALSDRPPLGLDGTVEYSPSETTMAQPQPLPHDEAVGVEMPSHHEGNETKAGHEMSEDERGSLLSHDPDDDDAEPEWLEVVSD
ncbi:MAG: hypothetical protein INR71_05850 [Terriglobus roseus]|nr:hypothetical protein [Terriglobus roseus]